MRRIYADTAGAALEVRDATDPAPVGATQYLDVDPVTNPGLALDVSLTRQLYTLSSGVLSCGGVTVPINLPGPMGDVELRWAAHTLKGKTPAQIYQLVQGRIDGWSNLAAAKADLRDWLPLVIAGLAWMVMEREG